MKSKNFAETTLKMWNTISWALVYAMHHEIKSELNGRDPGEEVTNCSKEDLQEALTFTLGKDWVINY